MRVIVTFGEWYLLLFLLILSGTVVVGMLRGSIRTAGLLCWRRQGGELRFSPGRLQLLIFTIGAAAYYVYGLAAAWRSGVLPDVSPVMVGMFAGSHGIYLGGQVVTAFLSSGEAERRT